MVKIVFVKIIEKIRELTDDDNKKSCETEKQNYEKLNRDSVFYGFLWVQKKRKIQSGLLDEFTNIKTEEKRYRKIACKNKKIAGPNHVVAERACISTENVGKGIRKKQESCEKFDEDERSSAILFQFVS